MHKQDLTLVVNIPQKHQDCEKFATYFGLSSHTCEYVCQKFYCQNSSTILGQYVEQRCWQKKTHLQYSSHQQGLDSTHWYCTQLSSSPLESDVGHSCRTPLNILLCHCSSPEIHSMEQQVDHSQLKMQKNLIFLLTVFVVPIIVTSICGAVLAITWCQLVIH